MITFVVLVAAARTAMDRRTLAGVIVLAIGLVAASRLAKERGMPGLDWYLRAGRSWLTDTLDSATGQEKPARSNPTAEAQPSKRHARATRVRHSGP